MADGDAGRVVAAVPALARTGNAAENRHHPCAIGAADKTPAHEGAKGQIDQAGLGTAERAILK
jgi:hypothetical protein